MHAIGARESVPPTKCSSPSPLANLAPTIGSVVLAKRPTTTPAVCVISARAPVPRIRGRRPSATVAPVTLTARSAACTTTTNMMSASNVGFLGMWTNLKCSSRARSPRMGTTEPHRRAPGPAPAAG
eukprot:351618_1